MRLLSRAFEQLELKEGRQNLSFLDRCARGWLRARRQHAAVVDCDEGMGDIVLLRSELRELVFSQLQTGFTVTTRQQHEAQTFTDKLGADLTVNHAADNGIGSGTFYSQDSKRRRRERFALEWQFTKLQPSGDRS